LSHRLGDELIPKLAQSAEGNRDACLRATMIAVGIIQILTGAIFLVSPRDIRGTASP
jgi:hypothetical protein